MTVNDDVREVVVYIHGVSNDTYAEPHTDLYNNFNRSDHHLSPVRDLAFYSFHVAVFLVAYVIAMFERKSVASPRR